MRKQIENKKKRFMIIIKLSFNVVVIYENFTTIPVLESISLKEQFIRNKSETNYQKLRDSGIEGFTNFLK